MITGHIANTDPRHYPPAIAKAIACLTRYDLLTLAAGRYQDSETGWVMQVLDLHTVPAEENYPEAHRLHIDVQYLVTGEEVIGVATQPVDFAVHQPYDPERDIFFTSTCRMRPKCACCRAPLPCFFRRISTGQIARWARQDRFAKWWSRSPPAIWRKQGERP